MEKRVHILLSGKVQGVFFRESTKKKARMLGLKGVVKNLENGCVEIIAEGEEEKLKMLSSWCDDGPPLARVQRKDVKWQKSGDEFKNFITK